MIRSPPTSTLFHLQKKPITRSGLPLREYEDLLSPTLRLKGMITLGPKVTTKKQSYLTQHFRKVFQENDTASTLQPTLLDPDAGIIKHTSPLEVASIIDKLKNRKSPGHDRISPIIIR